MTFKRRYAIPLLAASAAATVIAAAPTAVANPKTCSSVGAATICDKQGHTSITTIPPVQRGQQSVYGPFLPPYYPLR